MRLCGNGSAVASPRQSQASEDDKGVVPKKILDLLRSLGINEDRIEDQAMDP